jgi:peptidoglycan/xylan/chitin deacetylase (PgdA/CDA1 family)
MVKKHHSHNFIKQHEFLLGALTGIIFITIGALVYLGIQKYLEARYEAEHPLIETKKTMVKVLPPEVKKQLQTASPSATFRVPILLYHYVEVIQDKKDRLRAELNISPTVFEEQVKTLKNAGYTFMTAKELGDVLDGKMQLPAKPVLLTFDDGHWDFATDVLPILQKYHVKATSYIITGFIGGSDFMTQAQLETVIKSGLVDVGAHTVHHLALKGRPYSIVQKEIDDSKKTLEDTYHLQVVSFAYPNGSFDLQAVQLVKDDGFTTAVSTVPGIEQNQANRYFLYRLRPGYRTGQSLLAYLTQNTFNIY